VFSYGVVLGCVVAPNSVTSFYSPGSDSWVRVGPSGQSTPTIADRRWDQQVANGEFNENAQIVTGIALNAAASALPALSLGKAAVTAATPLILQNAARGSAFETAALNALGAAKNSTRVTVPGLGSSVPDVITAGAITEIKNVANLSFTQQLRIQATASQGPFNLIVSPTTQSISRTVGKRGHQFWRNYTRV
jgi:hypothetical protein